MSYLLTDSPPPLKRLKVSGLVGGAKATDFLSPGKKKKIKGKGGSSCHQCKSRRNFTALTYCTSNLDKKNKKCRKKFCGHCLKKFYKETPQAISDRSTWRCPSCRKICCCAACRRRKQRDSGFAMPPSTSSKPKSFKKSHSIDHMDQMDNMDSMDQMDHMNHMDHHMDQMDPNMGYNSQNAQDALYAMQQGHGSSVPPQPGQVLPYRSEEEYPQTPLMRSDQFQVGGFSPIISSTISSPITTPLLSGTFSDFPCAYTELGEAYPDTQQRIQASSSEFPSLLAREIRKQAKQASQDKNNSQFAHLYAVAQTPSVSNRIHTVLSRTDISQDQKVGFIAQILRHHDRTPS